MSPIRRYLRITKFSVLEVRIYLDKPSDSSWLLSGGRNNNTSASTPVLQRILDAVRPHVLPKLREENEQAVTGAARKNKKKKRGIKDVVATEDFEVTIYLTELSTRHSLLTKRKTFAEKPRLQSRGKGLASWLNQGKDAGDAIRLEEEEEEQVDLRNIPEMDVDARQEAEDEALFVSSSDEETFGTQRERRTERRRRESATRNRPESDVHEGEAEEEDDKKKLGLSTSYDGFSIYGRILCLVVKRKGIKAASNTAPLGGSRMMEQWVSTQAAQEAGLEEDEEG